MNNHELNNTQDIKSGSEWCNTDPAKCNDLGNGIKIVNLSVDTLYISCNGLLKDGVTAYLDQVKKEAIESGEPRFGYDYMEGRILVIQPYGKRGYTYLLDSDDFSIKIGDGKVGPVIYAELRSHFLYTLGYEEACQVVLDILKDFILTGEFIVSRIDLCADVVGWQPTPDINERIITRSKNKKYYFDGNDFTGFEYGSGNSISCRIYHKTKQIKKKNIQWIEKVWEIHEWNSEIVWRIEYQLRREILKQFKVNTPKEVFLALNSIWKYCTAQWLSLKIPLTNDRTKSRWPLESWWDSLSKQEFSSSRVEVVRDKYIGIKIGKMIDGALAYTSSIAALSGIIDQGKAFSLVETLTGQRLSYRGRTFEQIVLLKQKQKGIE